MMYPSLQLPLLPDRPFFYSNFVQSIDGKIQVTTNSKGYWPLGSEEDFDTLIGLRAYADVLIHGRRTATWFRALDRFGTEDFQNRRRKAGKPKPLLYALVSGHPDASLLPFLENPPVGATALLVTTDKATVAPELSEVPTLRCGAESVDVNRLSEYLHSQGMRQALVEGGPHLLGGFAQADLLDELFVTITPKLIGTANNSSLTMLEGYLFPAEQVPLYSVVSVQQHKSELYLRYRRA